MRRWRRWRVRGAYIINNCAVAVAAATSFSPFSNKCHRHKFSTRRKYDNGGFLAAMAAATYARGLVPCQFEFNNVHVKEETGRRGEEEKDERNKTLEKRARACGVLKTLRARACPGVGFD